MVFGILGNIDKKELKVVLTNLLKQEEELQVEFVFDIRFLSLFDKNESERFSSKSLETNEVINNSDIILSFGGDGTMLSVARLLGNKEKPIIGVNLGKLGFLAEIAPDQIYEFIKDVKDGNYIIEERMVLSAHIKDQKYGQIFGLNDIVIEKNHTSRVIDIEVFVNNDYVITLMSDGLIVCTPTGSTAYSLSSNGPIVVPSSQVMIINPICPHTLTARPIIIPDYFELFAIINSGSKEVLLTADGQVEMSLKTPLEVTIKKAEHKIKLMKRKNLSYYDLLRSKLMWGKDMRIEKLLKDAL